MKHDTRRGFETMHAPAVRMMAVLAIAFVTLSACSKEKDPGELKVYAYDSFVSEWGPGPKIVPKFEEKYGTKVNLISGETQGTPSTAPSSSLRRIRQTSSSA
jgi:ABC-type thiamine transport system substrate-binding protein